jgi:hypothetical protein
VQGTLLDLLLARSLPRTRHLHLQPLGPPRTTSLRLNRPQVSGARPSTDDATDELGSARISARDGVRVDIQSGGCSGVREAADTMGTATPALSIWVAMKWRRS